MHYKQADTQQELQQVLALQQANLRKVLRPDVMEKEGFVTVEHSLELLLEMNRKCGHVIALDGGQLAGYALCMHPEFRSMIPLLMSMFHKIDNHLGTVPYMVMGQVCVALAYRGKGVFRGLYEHMKKCLWPDYSEIVTEVDSRNIRSLQAHLGIGFRELETYESDDRIWHLISLSTKPG